MFGTRKSGAERVRESRARKAAGKRLVQIEINQDDIDNLVAIGHLAPEAAEDNEAIASALLTALRDHEQDATIPTSPAPERTTATPPATMPAFIPPTPPTDIYRRRDIEAWRTQWVRQQQRAWTEGQR